MGDWADDKADDLIRAIGSGPWTIDELRTTMAVAFRLAEVERLGHYKAALHSQQEAMADLAAKIVGQKEEIDRLTLKIIAPAYAIEGGKITPIQPLSFSGYICTCHNCGAQYIASEQTGYCPGCSRKEK